MRRPSQAPGTGSLEVIPGAGDISDEDAVVVVAAAVVAAAVAAAAAGGRVDALANVVGVMDHFAPIHEFDDATWDRVFRTNVTALMRLARAVAPLMLEATWGSQLAAGRLGPLMGANIPAPVTGAQLAASITVLSATTALTSTASSWPPTADVRGLTAVRPT